MKRLLLLAVVFSWGAGAAEPVVEKNLVERAAESLDAGLAQALTKSLGSDALMQGAHASQGSDFLFAVRSGEPPLLFINDRPVYGLQRIPASELWIAQTRLETGTSHAFYFVVEGKRSGAPMSEPTLLSTICSPVLLKVACPRSLNTSARSTPV